MHLTTAPRAVVRKKFSNIIEFANIFLHNTVKNCYSGNRLITKNAQIGWGVEKRVYVVGISIIIDRVFANIISNKRILLRFTVDRYLLISWFFKDNSINVSNSLSVRSLFFCWTEKTRSINCCFSKLLAFIQTIKIIIYRWINQGDAFCAFQKRVVQIHLKVWTMRLRIDLR